jgi:hypothetical protein
MKKCTKCKVEKQYTEFGKDNGTRTGYGSWCKKCKALNSKKNSDNKKKDNLLYGF